ncbi:hypothetical protein ACHAXR_012681 [Thalassiosira sp. AJA248-18]
MKKTSTQDYAYLTDLSDSDFIYRQGRDYLKDLPVRPTKRRQYDNYAEGSAYYRNVASWLRGVHPKNMIWMGHRANAIVLSTSISLVIGTVVCFQRIRKSASKKSYQTTDFSSGADIKEHNIMPRKRRKKRKRPAKKKCAIEHEEDQQTRETSVGTCNHEHIILGEPKCNQKEVVLVTQYDNAIVGHTTANLMDEPASTSSGITNHSYEQMASRWESRGLDRQKSLELAANFEINMFFFEQTKSFLSMASLQFLDQMNLFTGNIQHQIEKNHREIMEGPEMERLRRYRGQILYSLLNTKILTRCLLLALAARSYSSLRFFSPTSIWKVIIANLCPECTGPITEQSTLAATSYLASFALESWWNLVYEVPNALVCVARLFWCATCLGLCHQFVSRTLSFAILALVFIPWKGFLVTLAAVLATNMTLTLWMLKKCKNAEKSRKSQSTKQIIDYYDWIIPSYQTGVYLSSLLIGFYMAADA